MQTDAQVWIPMVAVFDKSKKMIWGKGPITPLQDKIDEYIRNRAWRMAFYNLKLKLRTKRSKSRRCNGRLR